MQPNLIVRGTRVFVALRKGREPTRGEAPIFHAVTPNCRMALCCAEPGAGSDWCEGGVAEVTCRHCLRRLERLANGNPSR